MAALRERVYATLVGLSTVVVLLDYAGSTAATEAVADIAAAMGALCLAGGFADISAHRIAHVENPICVPFEQMTSASSPVSKYGSR